jgi:tRNA modification GTPase
VLWLGPEGAGPAGRPLWEIETRIDRPDREIKHGARFALGADGEGMSAFRAGLVDHARAALPAPGEAALNARQAGLLGR